MIFPSQKDKDPKRKAIGKWIARKREAYHKGELSKLWINKFEQTFHEWSWSPIDERVQKNKDKLLEMARKGEPRPNCKNTKSGKALAGYIGKHSGSYNAQFDKKIREAAPQWFDDTANENKKKLLEMARREEPRPHSQKTRLGRALSRYNTNKQHKRNSEFDKEIREAAPQWFMNTADEKKKKLLEMARKGEPRPNSQKTKLGIALCDYTNLNRDSYDSKFDKEIREAAPQWFINTADENKKQLLEMAHKREPRPHARKTKSGQAFKCYISKSSSSYDPDFDKKIRHLAPHWFRS